MNRKTTIEAAGGLVRDDLGRVLMIFRRGHWDLPKGKLELGETIEQCAVREVEEECGLCGLSIVGSLGATEHTYFEGDREILKRTYWFLMEGGRGELVAQTEEGIEWVEWVDLAGVRARLGGCYSTIGELLVRSLGLD